MIRFFLFSIFYFLFSIAPAYAQTTPQLSSSFAPNSISSTTTFTVEIKVTSNQTMAAQVFTANISFDTSKLELTNITYMNGWAQSTNLGGDGNDNLTTVNSRTAPQIKLIGEFLNPAGFSLTANQPVSLASLTFRVDAGGVSTIAAADTTNIIWVKPDTSLQTLSITASSATVNQAGQSPSPAPTGTTSFKITESPTGPGGCSVALSAVNWQAYTAHPMPYTHTLSTPLSNNDVRTICTQFQKSDGTLSQVFTKTIRYTPDPTITRRDCTHSPQGAGTNITIVGVNLGAQGANGKVKVKGEEVDVTAWDETTGTISLTVPQRLEGRVALAVTTNDNKTITTNCTINVTTVEFDTLTQCKVAGQFAASNVDVKVYERQIATLTTPEPIQRQKITLDGQGKPQGFVPKFEKGKNYTLLIKVPGALAKKAEFKTEGGTTILDPISFAVGDIAPATAPDGKINAFDKSELIRQWSLVRDVSKTGDFNGDSRINSLDYSCMVKNFNASDETYTPLTVQVSPSPSATASPSATLSPTPTATPSATPATTGTLFRVSFDPNFSTAQTQQGNLDAAGLSVLNLTLPSGTGSKTVYIQFFENNAWVPATPLTQTITLTGT